MNKKQSLIQTLKLYLTLFCVLLSGAFVSKEKPFVPLKEWILKTISFQA